MKSKVTLYYQSLINKDKNFILDNLTSGNIEIENYLSTLTQTEITGFQYVKQQLSVFIKINSNQANLEMIDSKDLNYVKIANYDVVNNVDVFEKAHYYFVVSKNWRSKDTIELVLSMDTLNTFKFNSDYQINAKTLTKRMHKDRFYKRYTIYSSSSAMVDSLQNEEWDKYYYGTLYYEKDGVTKTCNCIMIHRQDVGLAHVKMIYFYDVPKSTYDDMPTGCYFRSFVASNGETLRTYNSNQMFFTRNIELIRSIDLKSEDISAPNFKKEEEIIYEDSGDFVDNWSLYYKNRTNQDHAPVDCYLMCDTDLKVTIGGSNIITASNVPINQYLLLSAWYTGANFYVTDDDMTGYVSNQNISPNRVYYGCVALWNDGGTLKWAVIGYQYRGTTNTASKSDPYTPITWKAVSGNLVIHYNKATLPCRVMSSVDGPWTGGTSSYPFYKSRSNFTLTLSTTTQTISSKYTIDKTLTENIKIINLPYCPSSFDISNNVFRIDPIWAYDGTTKFLKLTNFESKFKNTIYTNVTDYIDVFVAVINFQPALNANRYLIDSKLYHSDYYRPKFVYDSFSKVFPLEQIDYKKSLELATGINMSFEFVASRNIVSKFLFKFPYVYKIASEDYQSVLAVERNNEEVLYNSAYINYIRTGYNYDVKAKKRNEIASGVGIGISALGAIASVAVGGPYGAVGSVGFGVSLITSLLNYAKTTAQNDENIQRKLVETQRQGVSVSNADDYDLLLEYSNNKAKLCLYEASEQMKNVLDDLFYYGGYIVNEQMIPTINSRYWFNFVQASLIIEESSNLTSEIEDDIKEKFEQGVTFLHYHSDSTAKFDLKQEMENWETSLL